MCLLLKRRVLQILGKLSTPFADHHALWVHLIRGGIGSLAIKLGYVVLQFAISIALARLLEPAGYGAYSYVVALVGLLAVPANLGFPTYLTRVVAVYLEKGERSLLQGLLIGSRQLVALAATVLAATSIIVLEVSDGAMSGIERQIVAAGMLLLPLYALGETISGGIRGLGHVLLAQIPNQLIRPGLFLAFTLFMVAIGSAMTPTRAILAHAAAASLAVILGNSLLRLAARSALGNPKPQFAIKDWLLGALPFSLLAGAQLLNHYTDVIMLGMMMGDEPVGLYRVAIQMSDGLNMILLAITAAIAPQLARLSSRGDWQSVQRLLVTAHRFGIALLLPICGLLVFFREPFLQLAFGREYLASSGALLILIIGRVVYATVGFSGTALSMFGRPGIAAFANLLSVGANIVLNLMLIPTFGIMGAALATIVSDFAVNLMLSILLWIKYGLNITAFGKSRL